MSIGRVNDWVVNSTSNAWINSKMSCREVLQKINEVRKKPLSEKELVALFQHYLPAMNNHKINHSDLVRYGVRLFCQVCHLEAESKELDATDFGWCSRCEFGYHQVCADKQAGVKVDDEVDVKVYDLHWMCHRCKLFQNASTPILIDDRDDEPTKQPVENEELDQDGQQKTDITMSDASKQPLDKEDDDDDDKEIKDDVVDKKETKDDVVDKKETKDDVVDKKETKDDVPMIGQEDDDDDDVEEEEEEEEESDDDDDESDSQIKHSPIIRMPSSPSAAAQGLLVDTDADKEDQLSSEDAEDKFKLNS